MSRFQKKFDAITRQYFTDQPRPKEVDAPERYIVRGDPAAWAKTKPRSLIGWGHDLCAALPDPRQLEAEDRRAIQVIVLACGDFALGRWLNGHLETEPPGEDLYGFVWAALREQPRTAALVLPWTGHSVTCWETDAGLTSAGRFLLALPDADLATVVKHSGSYEEANPGSRLELLEFLFKHCPDRVPALGANLFAAAGDSVNGEVVEMLMERGGPACAPVVAAFADRSKDLWARFAAASRLAERDAEKYYPAAEKAGLGILRGKADSHVPGQYGPVAVWLLKRGGSAAVAKVAACMNNPNSGAIEFDEVLAAATETLGVGARPIVRAALEPEEFTGADGVALDAFYPIYSRLLWLIPIKESTDDDLIVRKLQRLAADAQFRWPLLIELAQTSRIPAAEELVWGLAEHKSKAVRTAAVAALAGLGDSAVPRAETLLQHRKADARETAVHILSAINTPRAREVLRARLAEEAAAKLCDLIRAALPEPKRAPAARQTKR